MSETTLFQTETDLDAKDVLRALREKHSKDIFVPEVKTGPSRNAGSPRMDAWAMNKSWKDPEYTAYEIKVDRSDFWSDEKWHNYLPYCNRFWFACPWKLILPHEVDDNVGLVWITSTGNRVIRKKKPAYREVDPADLHYVFRYLLMSRISIHGEQYSQRDSTDYWKRWLERKEEKQRLGRDVSARIRTIVEDARHRARKAEKLVEGYEIVKKRLEELDFDPEYPFSEWNIRRLDRALRSELEEATEIVDKAYTKLTTVQTMLHNAANDNVAENDEVF